MKPFWSPEATGFEAALVGQVLDSNYWNDGPRVIEFEKSLAKRIGVEHVVCASSGTAALFLSLKALGFGQNEIVEVPDVTFIATANAVRMTGAHVTLVPVGETLLMEEEPLDDDRGRVSVHVSGRFSCIADVEDACESFPIKPRGKIAAYSFSPNKLITTGQGGCVATNDDHLAREVRAWKDQGRYMGGTGGDDEHSITGFNFKMTDLQAAVGLAQLSDLDRRIDRRRTIHSKYVSSLGVRPMNDGEVPLWSDMKHPNRESVIKAIEDAGYGCRRFWHPLHTQKPYRNDALTTDTSEWFWLPSSFLLTDDDVERVIWAALS